MLVVTIIFTATFTAALTAFVAACGQSGGNGSSPDMRVPGDSAVMMVPSFCTDGADGGPPPTLASVETIFAANCALSACHDNGPGAASVHMDLRAGHVWASVVNVSAVESACGGMRVVPGDPSKSYLYAKLADADPCNGVPCQLADGTQCIQMPRCEIGSCPLPDCEIAIVKGWIVAGAPQQ